MIIRLNLAAFLMCMLGFLSCNVQTEPMSKDTSKNNPLLCDAETGACEVPGSETSEITSNVGQSSDKKIKLIYFTDPICSSCWGIEPQLRKLKLEYGEYLDIDYKMGGLLPNWSYDSGGISKPSDVAHHWDEVSLHYDMPIDGDVWLEDPLDSSYPPSIAYKAAQLQDQVKADLFMREIREMVFLKKKNIAKWKHLAEAAQKVGLDEDQLKKDSDGKANELFENDLKLARESGVRGFPTVFILDADGNQEMVYGSRPYAFYETAILTVAPTLVKSEYSKNWATLFSEYHSLTAKEFSVLSGTPRVESEELLNDLTEKESLKKLTTKNGSLWTVVRK